MFGTLKQNEDPPPPPGLILQSFVHLFAFDQQPKMCSLFYVNLLKCDPVWFGSLQISRISFEITPV